MTEKIKTILEDLKPFSEFKVPTYDEWKMAAEKALKGASFEKKLFTQTYEGITLKPMYQASDLEDLQATSSLPGFAPYVRGNAAVKSQQKPWEVAQEIHVFHPKHFNEVAKEQLQLGQTALSIELSSLAKFGTDDNSKNHNHFTGTNVLSYSDLKEAFDGIDLESIPVYVNAGLNGLPFYAMLFAYMKETNQELSKCSGLIGMDPIYELTLHGELHVSLHLLYDAMAELTKQAIKYSPNVQTILVQGHNYASGGGNAIHELAFSMATAVSYIRELQKRGLSIDDIAPRMRFSFSIGTNVFMEISKIRAARMIWANIIKAFGGNEESQKMKIHGRTSTYTKTVYDPYVNILRGTVEAFSGIIGGIDSLHVSPFDELIRERTEFSERIARNTQLILKEEAHLGKVVDPAGGSWYVETLTHTLAKHVWSLFQEIEEKGGIVDALKQNIVQRYIEETKKQRMANIEKRKDIFVGTNMYPNLKEEKITADQDAFDNERKLYETTRMQLAKSINEAKKAETLQAVKDAPNSFEALKEALLAGATLAEIIQVLPTKALKIEKIEQFRGAELFEQLRIRSENFEKRTGKTPSIHLANIGALKVYKPRADFASGFFQVGGYNIVRGKGGEDVEAIATEAATSDIVVICSSDDLYEQYAASVAKAIKATNANATILLAGRPNDEWLATYKDSGIEDFIYLGANCYEMINKLQQEKGVY